MNENFVIRFLVILMTSLSLLWYEVEMEPFIARSSRPVSFERQETDCEHADGDMCRNVTQLIVSKGYQCEEYHVTTEDGFILGIQRIPHGHRSSSNAGRNNGGRPVVFLQHGLLDSSTTWVINLASQSLGFILADAGFDVWLGNMRGNTYSRSHIKYHPDDSRFWAWSWDEMANYDLPAMLQFVMSTTGQSELSYVGHSQGTSIAFARFSNDQLLAKHIKSFIALGPVRTLGHAKGAVRVLVNLVPETKFLFNLFGVNEFLPNNEILRFIASTVCRGIIFRYLCEDFVFLISGFDHQQMNASRLPVYFSHTPAGTSVQNMVHFAQMVKSNKFQMYDYGSEKDNLLHYNQSVPPVYNVSTINIPTYVYSGENDWLADRQDVNDLIAQLRSLKSHKEIAKWEHLDFIWAVDANVLLYKEIVQILEKHVFVT